MTPFTLGLVSHSCICVYRVVGRPTCNCFSVFVFPEMEGGDLFSFVVGQRREDSQNLLNTLVHKVAKDLLSGLKVSSFLVRVSWTIVA